MISPSFLCYLTSGMYDGKHAPILADIGVQVKTVYYFNSSVIILPLCPKL
jgi:hypothetical protein